MKESDLVKSIIKLVNASGGYCWRTNAGKFQIQSNAGWANGKSRWIQGAPPGTADVIGWWRKGQFLAIECKIGYNKPTEVQTAFLDAVKRAGGIGFVAYSVEDVYKNLNE